MTLQICQHIKPGGTRCGSPALRGLDFCFYHSNMRESMPLTTMFDVYGGEAQCEARRDARSRLRYAISGGCRFDSDCVHATDPRSSAPPARSQTGADYSVGAAWSGQQSASAEREPAEMRERDWGEGGVTLRISHTRNRSARDDWRRLAVTWGSFEGRGPSTPVRAKAARACAQDDRLEAAFPTRRTAVPRQRSG
jgi:hypothetical protein